MFLIMCTLLTLALEDLAGGGRGEGGEWREGAQNQRRNESVLRHLQQ